MENTTMLSRAGRTNPGGKLDRRLDILVTEELESGIIALAAMHGVPKGEFVRASMERLVFGELPMIRRIAGLGQAAQGDDGGRNVG